MNFRRASSSDRLPSLLKRVNTSTTSELGGSLDRTPLLRSRTTPGFAGPERTSAEERESATECASSGVSRISGA
jgi:hypothetical protein